MSVDADDSETAVVVSSFVLIPRTVTANGGVATTFRPCLGIGDPVKLDTLETKANQEIVAKYKQDIIVFDVKLVLYKPRETLR